MSVGGSAASACARAEAKLRHVCEVGGRAGAQKATHDTTHPAGAEAAEHQGAELADGARASRSVNPGAVCTLKRLRGGLR
jgi:hypothetical protein